MRLWKKLLLAVLVLLVLSQIPFAYRRYQLGKLQTAILHTQSQRQVTSDGLYEFTGVVHVHSFLGGHSTGTFQEIIDAAATNHLDFVVMTEHPAEFDTSAMTLKGRKRNVLFVNGNEVRTSSGDRLLLLPGDGQAAEDSRWTTQEVLSRRSSGAAIVAYPEEFQTWHAKGFNGIEVYNLYTNSRSINPLVMFFDGLWSVRTYPELLFSTFYERPTAALKRWDAAMSNGGNKLVAIAGNDAHANVGLTLSDSSGKTLFGLKLDPYERSFRLVRMHVLTPFDRLEEESLLAEIRAGHCFIGYDVLGDTSGFRFTARNATSSASMGDEINLDDQLRLSVKVPVPSRVMLFHNGNMTQDQSPIRGLEFQPKEKGIYRVEVYLPQLPGRVGGQPWIISNAIYVR